MKTILITGCSSGIGYNSAKTLQERGYEVYTTARKKEDIQRLQDEGFFCTYLDYDDKKSITNTIKEVLNKTNSKLDAVFNNGAYGQPGALEDISREVLEQQFSTNVFGWHQMIQEILPIMRKQGYGRIIQNSSVLGLIALKNRGCYVASKYAIEGLSDTLRLELKNTNIHISLIEPGPIVSKFRENAYKKFIENIDIENSFNKDIYEKQIKRFNSNKNDPFTLNEEAVTKQLIKALESKNPKARYFVTFPTYLFAYTKRLLPDFLMDKILSRV
jgi:short-subunit dehydrogenase